MKRRWIIRRVYGARVNIAAGVKGDPMFVGKWSLRYLNFPFLDKKWVGVGVKNKFLGGGGR